MTTANMLGRAPRPGKLPTQVYGYDDANGVHSVQCSCGRHIASDDPLAVRRFVANHVGEHARARIVNPLPEAD